MRKIILVLDNIRSAHNVGSILRSADGLGIQHIIMCGITPYPLGSAQDSRLPHIAKNAHKMIAKTALGAEKSVDWHHENNTADAINKVRKTHKIVCLEQADGSKSLDEITREYANHDIAVVVGTEVHGISKEILALADAIVEIPMRGQKESLNVSVASAIAMYELAKA